jgi:Ni,Fe-hydrogenase III large subunit
MRTTGDVDARIRVRFDEIAASLRQIGALAPDAPAAGPDARQGGAAGEAIGLAEGPRGAICYWVRVQGDTLTSVFIREPAVAALCGLEAALQGAKLACVPVIQQSFGVSPGAADL